ncbi:MAG: hypothetical protein KKF26_04505, partial [Chloroflexi bacterium]|nr:hypothetical protein [Chloroflexota bacterium]
VSNDELGDFKQALDNQTVNPMELKKRLGRELVSQLYNENAANEAEEHFARVVQQKEVPEEIEEFRFSFLEVAKPRAESVKEAEEHFARVVQQKEVPEEIEEHRFSFLEVATPPAESVDEDRKTGLKLIRMDDWDVSRIIVHTGRAKSRSEANRLISQGAVSVDGEKISGNIALVKNGSIIKVGKRRYARVINTDTITE